MVSFISSVKVDQLFINLPGRTINKSARLIVKIRIKTEYDKMRAYFNFRIAVPTVIDEEINRGYLPQLVSPHQPAKIEIHPKMNLVITKTQRKY